MNGERVFIPIRGRLFGRTSVRHSGAAGSGHRPVPRQPRHRLPRWRLRPTQQVHHNAQISKFSTFFFLEALQSIMSHPRLRVPSFSGSSSTIKLETSSYPSFLDGSEGNTKATLRPAAISRTAVRIGTRLLPARPRTTATGRRWATSAVRVSVSTCCRSWPTISASRTT